MRILTATTTLASCALLLCAGCTPQDNADSDATTASADAEIAVESVKEIQLVAPEGWTAVPASGLQRAAYQISDGDLSVEVTAMRLPGAATKLLPNVNMWRRRVGLAAIDQEQLDGSYEKVTVGGRSGQYFVLEGPDTEERPMAMLVVLASGKDHAWFFRMHGDAELVRREKERFEGFVQSARLPASG